MSDLAGVPTRPGPYTCQHLQHPIMCRHLSCFDNQEACRMIVLTLASCLCRFVVVCRGHSF